MGGVRCAAHAVEVAARRRLNEAALETVEVIDRAVIAEKSTTHLIFSYTVKECSILDNEVVFRMDGFVSVGHSPWTALWSVTKERATRRAMPIMLVVVSIGFCLECCSASAAVNRTVTTPNTTTNICSAVNAVSLSTFEGHTDGVVSRE